MHENGYGVKTDPGEAAAWYRLAAAQKNALAQERLGHLSENGLGQPKDLGAAAKWYQLAAKQDNQEAQNKLGRLYESGQGRWYVRPDLELYAGTRQRSYSR